MHTYASIPTCVCHGDGSRNCTSATVAGAVATTADRARYHRYWDWSDRARVRGR
jgi:hypothetical protein